MCSIPGCAKTGFPADRAGRRGGPGLRRVGRVTTAQRDRDTADDSRGGDTTGDLEGAAAADAVLVVLCHE
ncbi:hypothetical protein ACRJ4W_05540 [Streptomyces sp. GLT-R25]